MYALVIMTCVSILLTGIIGFVVSQMNFSTNRVEYARAFQIAESGIYYYRWYLAHATDGMNAQQLKAFWQNSATLGVSGPVTIDYKDPETGETVGQYTITLNPPDPYSTIATITVVGQSEKLPDVTRTVRVRFRRPSWSEYAALANDFMRFGQGTEVYGKIHSNKGIRFDGVAHNSVTSLVPKFNDPDHSGSDEFGVHTHVNRPPLFGVNDLFRPLEAPPNPVQNRPDVFAGGRQFPVPEVGFASVQSDLSFMKKTACNYDEGTGSCTVTNTCWASGCYFDNTGYGRHIVFSGTTMSVRTVTDYSKDAYDASGRVTTQGTKSILTQSSATSYTIPDNGIIFVDDNVWLEGTVNEKRVTVAAANTGTIQLPSSPAANAFLGFDNLRYTNHDGRDIIGVVAQNNVEIMKQSQTNLTIDAALLAQNGRVGREYYTCSKWAYALGIKHCDTYTSGDYKNSITVNGSLATNVRYGFAYTDGTGYDERNLNFDNNLLYYPPPYFPTGTEYSIDLWEER